MPTLTDPRLPNACDGGSRTIAGAAALLAPRWALPDELVTVALTDMADELGVDVGSLAAFVIRSSLG